MIETQNELIQTNDLYYGAYLMVSGNQLEGVSILDKNCKKLVVFKFGGERIFKSAHEYISGRAKANVNQLRAAIDHLKRIAYQRVN